MAQQVINPRKPDLRHVAQDELRDGQNQAKQETDGGAEPGDAVQLISGVPRE